MNGPWLLILPAMAIFACGSYAAYNDGIRSAAWYPWLAVLLAATSGYVWGCGSRAMPTVADVYRFSICLDAVAVVTYIVVPVAFFGVRPTNPVVLGLILILAGTVLVKLGV